ncbi:MAG: hypothetical protein IKJ30_04950 [Bacilli bacterium]|nr:hypothetical protein [Bacilli bacterium]
MENNELRLKEAMKLFLETEKNKYSEIEIPTYIDEKERINKVYIENIEYSSISNQVKVTLLYHTYYKKIERYTQVDYVKTPIYSDVLVKENRVEEYISANLKEFEALRFHKVEPIRESAYFIIAITSKEESTPKWAKDYFIEYYHHHIVTDLKEEYEKEKDTYIFNIEKVNNEIALLNRKINKLNKNNNDEEASLYTYVNKGINLGFKNHKLLSKWAFKRAKSIDNKLLNKSKEVKELSLQEEELKNKKAQNEAGIALLNRDYQDKMIKENMKYEFDKTGVVNYANSYDHFEGEVDDIDIVSYGYVENTCNEKFVSVKDKSLEKYDLVNIIALYVLKNVSKNEYYIGVSFDISDTLKCITNSKLHKDSLLKQLLDELNEDSYDIFEIYVERSNNKEELITKFKELKEKYKARYSVL